MSHEELAKFIHDKWIKARLHALSKPSFLARSVFQRQRTWRERLFSWPWRPWVKVVFESRPPKDCGGDVRVVIRRMPDITVVPYPTPTKIIDIPRRDVGDGWRTIGNRGGATKKYRAPGWTPPKPTGQPTGLQCDLGNEAPENRWLDED